jgi:cell division protein FtsL
MIKITQTKVNVLLLLSIILLSLQTISWHNDMRRLHLENSKVLREYNVLIADNKQLLLDRSSVFNGSEVKSKAINILHMRPPIIDEDRPWKSEVQYLELSK